MNPEVPPVQIIDKPPPTNTTPPVGIVGAPLDPNQAQPVPHGEATPPTSAENISQPTLESAHTQVMGWVGKIDLTASPEEIIRQANIIRMANHQPEITLEEGKALVVLAQSQERDLQAQKIKKQLEAAVNTPKHEEPHEESREQVKDHISDAWEEGMELLVTEADANLWDENASGISAEDKAIRIAAKRWKLHLSATEEYKKRGVDQEDQRRRDAHPPEPELTESQEKAFRENLHRELRKNPAQLRTKQYAYDRGKGQYVVYSADGKTEIDRFASIDLVEPARTGLQQLTEKVGADGKPTSQATEAQKVNHVLQKYYIEERGFPARTESELRLERRKEAAVTAADAVSRQIIEKAAADIEAKKTPDADFYLSSLAMWRKELQDLPADASRETVDAYTALITEVTNELLVTHNELKTDPDLAESRQLLEGNTEYYRKPGNDPLSQRIKQIIVGTRYAPDDASLDELIQKLGPGKMFLITAALDSAVQYDAAHPMPGVKTKAAESLSSLLSGTLIDGEQFKFLSHLVGQQEVGTYTNTCAEVLKLSRDKLKQLSNPLKYLQDNAESIANMFFDGKATDKIIAAFKALTNVTPEMMAKFIKEHSLPMSQIMLILMILPMLQGALDTGGGPGEEPGGRG